MLCFIADIKTKVPIVGGMASRCRDYFISGSEDQAQIVIDDALYCYDRWPGLNDDDSAYMESARQFYYRLLDFDGLMLHASATVINGEAYLFAGHSGIGKSTHAELLMKLFPEAQLINDDKPALRCINGTWFAYGTPWSGKNGININASYPVKAICLLTARRDRNDIRLAEPLSAISGLIACSVGRTSKENLIKLTPLLDKLMDTIPIYEMDSLANDDTAQMAYYAMNNGMTE